jgi:hypothetical protein
LVRAGVVEQIVRVAVAVKVGCGYQYPAAGDGRPISASEPVWA